MKKRFFLIGITCTLMLEIIVLIIFSTRTPDLSQDIVAVNEVIQSVTQDFDHLENHQNETNLQYVVLDHNEQILYKTSTGLSENIHSAICNRDTILDIEKMEKFLEK